MSRKNFKDMQDEVLFNVGVKNKVTTQITALRAQIKIWLNDALEEAWELSTWNEAREEATVNVGAGENTFELPSELDTVVEIWKDTTPLEPIDVSQINKLDASLWSYTGEPACFYSLGKSGIRLMGTYTEDTTLSLFGKCCFCEMIADASEPCLDHAKAYIAHATSKAAIVVDTNTELAAIYEAKWTKFIKQKMNEQNAQSAQKHRIIPSRPWTGEIDNATRFGNSNSQYWRTPNGF